MNKKDLLKLFKKYGFDSSLKEPFLYEDKDKIGIYYTFKDEIYGQLNRVYIPKDLQATENFLQNYYAYQNSHCNLIKLESYNDPFAMPTFINNIELLNENIVLNYNEDNPFFRSAQLLIKIIKEKMDLSLLTYENVKKLTDKYTRVKQELFKRKNLPLEDITIYNPKVTENIKFKQDNIVKELKESLDNCQTNEELKKIIDDLVKYLKSLELEDSLINNKYFMLKIPIEINNFKEEIKLFDEYSNIKLKKKKKLEFEEKLRDLEEKHNKNKVVSLGSFLKNEQERIYEKYNMISEIDYESIADYLIEFDNLDIKADIIIKEEQGIKILKDYFETLNDKDKNTLYLITFFNNIINNYNQYILEDYYKTILNPVNVLVKIKLFKDIDFSSIKNFGNSVKETINKIDKIKQIEMPCNIVGYFVGEKIMNKELFICSSNKSCMPKLNSNNPCTYIVLIKKGTLVNYVPSKLTIDIIKDDKIVLKEDNPLFIFSSKKNKILDENSDIIKVSKIKILEKKTTDIITVNKIKIEEINCYKKIEVERNDNNG